MTLALILLLLIGLLLTGAPVFAVLGSVSLGILLLVQGQVGSAADIVFGKLNTYLLIAIPLFAFMAHVMIRGKVVDDLYAMAHTLVRHLPGGLGVATVLSCTVFAAISGSSVATALTIGTTAIPQMLRYNYRPHQAYGVVAAGGTLGILIPPSGPMILYAVVSDTSIGALFAAGLVPGLLLAGVFAAFCMTQAFAHSGGERLPRASIAQMVRAVWRAFAALLLPPLVLGGMYLGIFTATEAAAVGVVAAILVAGIVYRQLSFRTLYDAAYETVRTTAMLFFILVAAALFGHVLTILRLPAELVEAVVAAGVTKTLFLIAVMAAIFVLGMFLETISIILVTTPIVLPALAALDIDPVWYGILLMINLELALITPPVGMNIFVIKGITQARIGEIIRGVGPYVLLMLLGLVLLFAFPGLALWLPDLLGYGR